MWQTVVSILSRRVPSGQSARFGLAWYVAILLLTAGCRPNSLNDPLASAEIAMASCGGRQFPISALDVSRPSSAATAAQRAALDATIAEFGPSFPEAQKAPWRLVAVDLAGATFLAFIGPGPERGQWMRAEVSVVDGEWLPAGLGYCDPRPFLGDRVSVASWIPDPGQPPDPSAQTLHVLVWDPTCASGAPLGPRLVVSRVDYTSASIAITIGVRWPSNGPNACRLPPPEPNVIELRESVGTRVILDGGRFPAQAPTGP
jgi:hypothetical protein